MKLSNKDILNRLGNGESIGSLCLVNSWSREDFDAWWRVQCRERVPAGQEPLEQQGVEGPVKIQRDARGVPHIKADRAADLFFGFGYATAQDRLFQLDM